MHCIAALEAGLGVILMYHSVSISVGPDVALARSYVCYLWQEKDIIEISKGCAPSPSCKIGLEETEPGKCHFLYDSIFSMLPAGIELLGHQMGVTGDVGHHLGVSAFNLIAGPLLISYHGANCQSCL